MHSSCLTLDVNEVRLDGRMRCTFIHPAVAPAGP
jgi:hypothetical protein